ncbi:hypothetical protein BKA80DRAFT_256618 [Phyllosticta citrichinensis]
MNPPSPLTRDALEASQRAHARGQPQPLTNAMFPDGLSPPFDQDNYFVRHPLFDTMDRLKVNLALISCLEEDYEFFAQLTHQSIQQMRVDEESGCRSKYETRARMVLYQARQIEHKREAAQVYNSVIRAYHELPSLSEMWAQAKAFHARNMPPHVFTLRVPQDIENEVANLYVEISALEQKAMAGELGLWSA